MEMVDELIDRFGSVPRSVMSLLEAALFKAQAHAVYVTEVKAQETSAKLFLYRQAPFKVEEIPKLIRLYNGALRFIPEEQPLFLLAAGRGKIQEKSLTIPILKNLLNDIKLLLLP